MTRKATEHNLAKTGKLSRAMRHGIRHIAAPLFASVAFEQAHEYLLLPHIVAGALPAVAELFKIWAVVGVVWLVGMEIIEEATSKFERAVTTAVLRGLRYVGRMIARILATKDFLQPPPPGQLPPSTAPTLSSDPSLAGIREMIEKGETRAAIESLRDFVAKKPENLPDLLTAMVLSNDERDWESASALLDQAGEPRHFMALGYNYWRIGKTQRAIELSEQAIQRTKDKFYLMLLKNNLAYYIADAHVTERGAEALEDAEEALRLLEDLRRAGINVDSEREARLMATLGYVKVTFAQSADEVEQGLDFLERGRAAGANLDLYFRHVERARKRSVELAGGAA